MQKPRFAELKRFVSNLFVTGLAVEWDTSLPFERGELQERCWIWYKPRYAFMYRGRMVNPAKFAFTWLIRPLSSDETTRPCERDKHCVNPYHSTGVQSEPFRGQCRNEHITSFDNTYTSPNGKRECKHCRRSRWKRYRNKTKTTTP